MGKTKEMLKRVCLSFHSQIQYCLGIDNSRGNFYILEYSKGEQYSFKKIAMEVSAIVRNLREVSVINSYSNKSETIPGHRPVHALPLAKTFP